MTRRHLLPLVALLAALGAAQARAGGTTPPGIVQSGAVTAGHCYQIGASGVAIDSGATCGTGTAGVVQSQGTALQILVNGDASPHTGATTYSLPPTVTLGANGTATGTLTLDGQASGGITIQPQAAAGTYNLNLPITAGAANAPLLSGGGGSAPMSFGTRSGNTTTFATSNGTLTANHCASFDASGNVVDAGAACQPILHTPANSCGAPTDGVTDASTQINTCIGLAIAGGWPLYIDQPYAAASSIILQTGIALECAPNGDGRIVQITNAHTGLTALVGQSSYTSKITGWSIQDCEFWGDQTFTLGGNIVSLYYDDAYMRNVTVRYFGGGSGGRGFLLNGNRGHFFNLNCRSPSGGGGAGGVRFTGGDDWSVFGGHCDAGDDSWQMVPGATGVRANDSIHRGSIIGVTGTSQTARLFLAGLVDPTQPNGTLSLTAVIDDVSFSSVKGGSTGARGVVVSNQNSSGGIHRLSAGDFEVDATGDHRNPQTIFVSNFGESTPIEDISFHDFSVLNPYAQSFSTAGRPKNVTVQNGFFGRPQQPLLTTLNATVNAGDTTFTVPSAAVAAAISNGDAIELVCDDNGQSDGDRAQPNVVNGAPSGTTVTLTTAALCKSSAGSSVYDFNTLVLTLDATATSGHDIFLPAISNLTVGDATQLTYDDGTVLSTTISAINSTPTTCVNITCYDVTLTASIAKTATQGNRVTFIAPTVLGANGNTPNSMLINGLNGGYFVNIEAYGMGIAPVQVGSSSVVARMSSNIRFENATFRDIPAAQSGISKHQAWAVHDIDSRFVPDAGVTTANAILMNTSVMTSFTTLASSQGSGDATLAATDGSSFLYFPGPFYIKIDSEIEYVTTAPNTISCPSAPCAQTWNVNRAALGTTAASHTSTSNISMAQAATVYSETVRPKLEAITGANNSLSGLFVYAIGACNWIRDPSGIDDSVRQASPSGAWTYSDIVPLIKWTGSNTTTSATISTSTPPFCAAQVSIVNDASGTPIINNGSGINNGAYVTGAGTATASGGNISLTAQSAITYRFSPLKQQLYTTGMSIQ